MARPATSPFMLTAKDDDLLAAGDTPYTARLPGRGPQHGAERPARPRGPRPGQTSGTGKEQPVGPEIGDGPPPGPRLGAARFGKRLPNLLPREASPRRNAPPLGEPERLFGGRQGGAARRAVAAGAREVAATARGRRPGWRQPASSAVSMSVGVGAPRTTRTRPWSLTNRPPGRSTLLHPRRPVPLRPALGPAQDGELLVTGCSGTASVETARLACPRAGAAEAEVVVVVARIVVVAVGCAQVVRVVVEAAAASDPVGAAAARRPLCISQRSGA